MAATAHNLLLLALGGVCGTLARYGLSGLVQQWTGRTFPWGTTAVNVVGCLLFGVVAAMAEERAQWSPQVRICLLTGFMGAFTTFSTYMYETQRLVADGQWLYAVGNLALQNVLGIAMLVLGLALGQRL
jgi:CrcB protein